MDTARVIGIGTKGVMLWIQDHPSLVIVAGVTAVVLLWRFFRVPALYGSLLCGAAGVAWIAGSWLYFWVFLVGLLTAFAEIISKWDDEPLKVFGTVEALVYHAVNGALAMFTLYILMLNGKWETPSDHVKVVLAAGLGSMLLMRSKLFELKVKDQDISFGPEQVVKVFFRFIEKAIDRARAKGRIDFVSRAMDNINCAKVAQHTIAMLMAPKMLDDKERQDLEGRIKGICSDDTQDAQIRSYLLGFALVDKLGEKFVTRIYDQPPQEWRLRAPLSEPESLWEKMGLPTRPVPYFAYGPLMSPRELRTTLRWSSRVIDWKRTKPQHAILEGHRLAFGRPAGPSTAQPVFSIVPDAGERMEGVVYWLPEPALQFLEGLLQPGYRRIPIRLKLVGNGRKQAMTGQAYVGDVLASLPIPDTFLDLMVAGAREHGLSAAYIERLRNLGAPGPTISEPDARLGHVNSSVNSSWWSRMKPLRAAVDALSELRKWRPWTAPRPERSAGATAYASGPAQP